MRASSGQFVLAFETLDCAKKVRIHYRLPRPLAPEWVASGLGLLAIQAFSRLARGAKDHLTLEEPGRWHAGGVVGERVLVVTFGKQDGARPVEAIARFEAALAQRCGPIGRAPSLAPVHEGPAA